jgi:hypothetical protein
MKTALTMDPIDIYAPRQLPIRIPFVHQVRALIFEYSGDQLSQNSLIIQLYTSVFTEVYPCALTTCAMLPPTASAKWQTLEKGTSLTTYTYSIGLAILQFQRSIDFHDLQLKKPDQASQEQYLDSPICETNEGRAFPSHSPKYPGIIPRPKNK